MAIIYKINCKANGKSYIGKSENSFEIRYTDGRFWAKTHNKLLQDDAYRYGSDQMTVEILIETQTIHGRELEELEQYFITKHRTFFPSGYNLRNSVTNEIKPQSKTAIEPPLESRFATFTSEETEYDPEGIYIKWSFNSDTIEDTGCYDDVLHHLNPRSLWEVAHRVYGTVMHFDKEIGRIKLLLAKPWKVIDDFDGVVSFGYIVDSYCQLKNVSDDDDFYESLYESINHNRQIDTVISVEDLDLDHSFSRASMLALAMAIRTFESTSTLVHVKTNNELLNLHALSQIGFIEWKNNIAIARSLSILKRDNESGFEDCVFSERKHHPKPGEAGGENIKSGHH